MKLSEYLKLEDQTATEFAQKIDVSTSTITRAINGERKPDSKTLSKIIAETGGRVTPNDFWAKSEAAE